ncbi:hypothetical protein U1Q18_015955, partial [Sarracenia purpurea var. burkii]
LPTICEHCRVFGHDTAKCKKENPEMEQKTWKTITKGNDMLRAGIQAPQDADVPSSSMSLCPSSPAHRAETRDVLDEAPDHTDVNDHDTTLNEEAENKPSVEIQTLVNMQFLNPR